MAEEKLLETIDYSNQVGNFALGKTAFIQQGNWVASDLAIIRMQTLKWDLFQLL